MLFGGGAVPAREEAAQLRRALAHAAQVVPALLSLQCQVPANELGAHVCAPA
jgi:hypothetical protein